MAQERDDLEIADESRPIDGDEADDGNVAEIRDQIEETRADMSETIDAIQEKLSIANISEQISEHVNSAVNSAKDAVYESTVGKAKTMMKTLGNELRLNTIGKTVLENPLPFILIGAGAGLLAYKGFSKSSSGSSSRSLRSAQEYKGDGGSSKLESEGRSNDAPGGASAALGKMTGAVKSAYSGTGEALGQAKTKLGELGSTAMETYEQKVQESPLAVATAALAVGAAVGFAIPSTNYEGQLLGGTRQDLLDRAKETASELIDKGKDLVGEAAKDLAGNAGAAAA